MTEAEKFLWSKIRRKRLKGVQFYRQKPIGNYIVDFYYPVRKIVIEIDGGQHYLEEGIEKDRIRDGYLRSLGLTVLRFSNIDVLQNIEGVVNSIYERL